MSARNGVARGIGVLAALLLAACTTRAAIDPPAPATSFAQYRSDTLQAMRAERSFQSPDREAELAWNAPQEWRPPSSDPERRPQKGVLLVHGLGDSPWSFHDIGPVLAAQGFLVRTVLLPGHGTRPEALLPVTAAHWRQVVHAQAQLLERDVDGPVFMGGFSTGANLALEYAYGQPEIAGLLLFSPGFKSVPFDWIAPLLARIRPWVLRPDGVLPHQTPVRYENLPINAFAQFYQTSARARELLARPYDKPVFMVVAQHDSVLDTDYLLHTFRQRFTHPRSRLVWYGSRPGEALGESRILVREDRLPAQRISQFSHMGLLFSPANALYGVQGSLRVCQNGQSGDITEACQGGAPVWYSDWGYREEGKVHARLTFNPYFEWQNGLMLDALGSSH